MINFAIVSQSIMEKKIYYNQRDSNQQTNINLNKLNECLKGRSIELKGLVSAPGIII